MSYLNNINFNLFFTYIKLNERKFQIYIITIIFKTQFLLLKFFNNNFLCFIIGVFPTKLYAVEGLETQTALMLSVLLLNLSVNNTNKS